MIDCVFSPVDTKRVINPSAEFEPEIVEPSLPLALPFPLVSMSTCHCVLWLSPRPSSPEPPHGIALIRTPVFLAWTVAKSPHGSLCLQSLLLKPQRFLTKYKLDPLT